MKKLKLVALLFFIFLFCESSYSQYLRVGLSGGINIINGSTFYNHAIESFRPAYNSFPPKEIFEFGADGLGFSNEPSLGLLLKSNLLSDFITLTASINNIFFYNKDILQYPPAYSNLAVYNDYVITRSNLFTIALGSEMILYRSEFCPYISVEAQYNSMEKLTLEGQKPGIQLKSSLPEKKFWGFSLGIGTEIEVINNIGLDLCLKYSSNNLTDNEIYHLNYFNLNAGILYNIL